MIATLKDSDSPKNVSWDIYTLRVKEDLWPQEALAVAELNPLEAPEDEIETCQLTHVQLVEGHRRVDHTAQGFVLGHPHVLQLPRHVRLRQGCEFCS